MTAGPNAGNRLLWYPIAVKSLFGELLWMFHSAKTVDLDSNLAFVVGKIVFNLISEFLDWVRLLSSPGMGTQ